MVAHHLERWLASELVGAVAAAERPGEGEAGLEDAMLEQLERFASRLYRRGGGFAKFMSYPASPVSAAIADIYDTSVAPNRDFTWVKTEGRYGLLTLPAFLSAKATPSRTSIVRRGLFVWEELLCRTAAPPPNGVDTTIPPPAPGETTRERYQRHATDPACAPCHRRIDPLGFAFENYDRRGRHRVGGAGGPHRTLADPSS